MAEGCQTQGPFFFRIDGLRALREIELGVTPG